MTPSITLGANGGEIVITCTESEKQVKVRFDPEAKEWIVECEVFNGGR